MVQRPSQRTCCQRDESPGFGDDLSPAWRKAWVRRKGSHDRHGAYGGKKGQGDTWLRGSLGQAAIGAARTATFLGERYARIARRRGKAKAQVAVARSILVIIWHLLKDPAARFTDLGYGYYQARTDTDRKLRNHIRQIQALGFDRHPDQDRITPYRS